MGLEGGSSQYYVPVHWAVSTKQPCSNTFAELLFHWNIAQLYNTHWFMAFSLLVTQNSENQTIRHWLKIKVCNKAMICLLLLLVFFLLWLFCIRSEKLQTYIGKSHILAFLRNYFCFSKFLMNFKTFTNGHILEIKRNLLAVCITSCTSCILSHFFGLVNWFELKRAVLSMLNPVHALSGFLFVWNWTAHPVLFYFIIKSNEKFLFCFLCRDEI